MRLVRRSSKKIFIAGWFIIFTIFTLYIEIYSYASNVNSWITPKCDNINDCTRILLVADPQIIGLYREVFHGITPISIFDSDNYLRKTYQYAYNFANPDVVVYLGDLMDEGSIATDEDFEKYVRRVFHIFLKRSHRHVKHIWLPGDNDIGGENFDILTKNKLNRFSNAFAQPDLIEHRNLAFFKINQLTGSFPAYNKSRDFYDVSRIFIGLSHLPLLFLPSPFVDTVLRTMSPQILFTAHEHKAMIIKTDALLKQDRHIIPITPTENNKNYEYSVGNTDLYEFLIPTCSYRMGTDKVGYGYALIEKNDIRFSILWSPSRFDQLRHYFILLGIFFFNSLYMICSK